MDDVKTQKTLRENGVRSIDITFNTKTHAIPLDYVDRVTWKSETSSEGTVYVNTCGESRGYGHSYTGRIRLKSADNTMERVVKKAHTNETFGSVNNVGGPTTVNVSNFAKGGPVNREKIDHIAKALGQGELNEAYKDVFVIAKTTPKPMSYVSQIQETLKNRQATYASPADNHELTQKLFELWHRYRITHAPQPSQMTAEDVCVFNIMQKLARVANGTHDDSYLDVVGYSENIAMLRPDQRNKK